MTITDISRTSAHCILAVDDDPKILNVTEIIRGAMLIEAKHHAAVDWGRLHRWLGQSCLRSGQRVAALGVPVLVHGWNPTALG